MRRIISTASWLTLALVATTTPARAQDWRVSTTDAWMDSTIATRVDTATVEHAWCAEATIDHDAHTITLTTVINALRERSERGEVQFVCPRGSIPMHSHFASRNHPRGPSRFPGGDYDQVRSLPQLPPCAIVVYREQDGAITFIPFSVR